MKAYDYDAVVYDGAVYCVECLPDGVGADCASPICADSEWDSYPTCDACGCRHDYVALTSDGIIYEAHRAGYEVFEHDGNSDQGTCWADVDGEPLPAGWYWWSCQPGCLPDGEPNGPYSSEAEAAADALGL